MLVFRKNFTAMLAVGFVLGLTSCAAVSEPAQPEPSGPSMTSPKPTPTSEVPDVMVVGEVEVDYSPLEVDPWVFVSAVDANSLTVVQGTLTNAGEAEVARTVSWFKSEFAGWGNVMKVDTETGGVVYGLNEPVSANNAQLSVVPSSEVEGAYNLSMTVTSAAKN